MAGKPSKLRGILTLVVVTLFLSGALRLGMASVAIAKSSEPVTALQAPASAADPDLAELLAMLQSRATELDEREAAVSTRERDLKASEALILENLAKLEATEQRLTQTVAKVAGASSDDIDRLTSVYEAMKPKEAALLFEQMTAEFAAGFLGRMSATAAAGIFSGLSAEKAYEVSVVLAGRNAKAPKE